MGIIERITEAEAVRDISGLIERVRTQGTSIEIVRGEEVVARISPAASQALPDGKPMHGTIEALLEAFEKVPQVPLEESELWEREVSELRKMAPMQVRTWD